MVHIGPNLLPKVFDTILHSRQYPVLITSHVLKIENYRQIGIGREHQDKLRVLWRARPHGPLQEYRVVTVIYGIACALFKHSIPGERSRNWRLLMSRANSNSDAFGIKVPKSEIGKF